MIISREEQDKKIEELFKEQLNNDLVDRAELHVIRLYAKWYAEKVIDRCAEIAELILDGDNIISELKSKLITEIDVDAVAHPLIYIDKQSILKVKEEL